MTSCGRCLCAIPLTCWLCLCYYRTFQASQEAQVRSFTSATHVSSGQASLLGMRRSSPGVIFNYDVTAEAAGVHNPIQWLRPARLHSFQAAWAAAFELSSCTGSLCHVTDCFSLKSAERFAPRPETLWRQASTPAKRFGTTVGRRCCAR